MRPSVDPGFGRGVLVAMAIMLPFWAGVYELVVMSLG